MNANLPAKLARMILSVSFLYLASLSQTHAASPTLVAYWDFNSASDPAKTLDKIYAFEGQVQNGAAFTLDQGGHTGLAGDRAMDFGTNSNLQVVRVSRVPFLGAAAAQDQITIAFWQKLTEVAQSSAFWGVSPSSNNGERGIQAHTPWSDNNIYFDTAGCCDAGTQRINKDVLAFDPTFDFTQWHQLTFVKNGSVKQVWLDGRLFLQGTNTAPLPSDFTRLMIGAGENADNSLHGMEDDFAVFAGALDGASIGLLAGGTAPDKLPGIIVSTGPLIGGAIGSPFGFALDIGETAANPILPSTLALTLDGNAVTASSVTKVGQITTVLYNLPANGYFPPGSAHTLNVSVQDTQGNVTPATRMFTTVAYSPRLESDSGHE